MTGFIQKNKVFFSFIVIFILFCAAQIIIYPKGQLVLAFNRMYHPALNLFFKYTTHLGDGVMFIVVALLLALFKKLRWGIIALITYAISGLLSQFLKKIVFGPLPRPHKYFEGLYELNKIEGVPIAYYNSFPSGHTATAFAMFTLLAFMGHKNPLAVTGCFVCAVLVALSRIYLGMHFTEDILAGTLLGFVCSCLIFYRLEEKKPAWISAPVFDKPLLKF